jgi:hypothetical protein
MTFNVSLIPIVQQDLVLSVLMDISRGMMYIHEKNIIHGEHPCHLMPSTTVAAVAVQLSSNRAAHSMSTEILIIKLKERVM